MLLLLALVCPKSAAAQVEPAASGAQGSSFDYEVAFERATLDYESGHYDRCVSAFRGLLGSPPAAASGELSERSTLHTYMSACLVASGRVELARQQFRVAILEDRQMRTPDPIVFPRSVVDLFVEVKGRLMGTLRRQQEEELRRGREQVEERIRREGRERLRVLELERLLETETVIRKNEPWMAWVPYGLGQFHNGDNGLGWSLLAVEAALTVSALAATSIELGLHSRADGGRANLDPGELNRAIRGAHTVGRCLGSACSL